MSGAARRGARSVPPPPYLQLRAEPRVHLRLAVVLDARHALRLLRGLDLPVKVPARLRGRPQRVGGSAASALSNACARARA